MGYVPAIIFRCEEHRHETRELAANPFQAEIYDKVFFMAACPGCLHEVAMDI